jgi:hypothetical protein
MKEPPTETAVEPTIEAQAITCEKIAVAATKLKRRQTLISDHAINALMAMISLVALLVCANMFVTAFWGRRMLRAIESHKYPGTG